MAADTKVTLDRYVMPTEFSRRTMRVLPEYTVKAIMNKFCMNKGKEVRYNAKKCTAYRYRDYQYALKEVIASKKNFSQKNRNSYKLALKYLRQILKNDGKNPTIQGNEKLPKPNPDEWPIQGKEYTPAELSYVTRKIIGFTDANIVFDAHYPTESLNVDLILQSIEQRAAGYWDNGTIECLIAPYYFLTNGEIPKSEEYGIDNPNKMSLIENFLMSKYRPDLCLEFDNAIEYLHQQGLNNGLSIEELSKDIKSLIEEEIVDFKNVILDFEAQNQTKRIVFVDALEKMLIENQVHKAKVRYFG